MGHSFQNLHKHFISYKKSYEFLKFQCLKKVTLNIRLHEKKYFIIQITNRRIFYGFFSFPIRYTRYFFQLRTYIFINKEFDFSIWNYIYSVFLIKQSRNKKIGVQYFATKNTKKIFCTKKLFECKFLMQ